MTSAEVHHGQLIGEKISPFNPTHDKVLCEAMSMLFGPDPECIVAPGGAVIFYDIGCGDGRVLCTAACVPNVMRAVGVEFDAELASRARKAAEALRIDRQAVGVRVADLEIRHNDARLEPAADATHIYAYLTPTGLAAVTDVSLVPLLLRGGRLVTHLFRVPGLKPVREWKWGAVYLYLYTSKSFPL